VAAPRIDATRQRLRIIAVAAALTAMAAAAGAQPAPPTSWRPQPELALPARQALATTTLSGTADAWGDPSTGRFALVQDYTSAAPVADTASAIAEVHASMRAALESNGAIVESWQVNRGESSVVFQLGTFQALARTRATIQPTGFLRAQSALCFYNDRGRDQSQRQCKHFVDSL